MRIYLISCVDFDYTSIFIAVIVCSFSAVLGEHRFMEELKSLFESLASVLFFNSFFLFPRSIDAL